MTKTVPLILLSTLLILVVVVCTGPQRPPRTSPERTSSGVDAGAAEPSPEALARFDSALANAFDLDPPTVTALRESLPDRDDPQATVPAVETYRVLRGAWGSELLALLTVSGEADRVAAAVADAGGDVDRAEQQLREQPVASHLWQTFAERRRDLAARFAEAPSPSAR
jgi:hypothetical protein